MKRLIKAQELELGVIEPEPVDLPDVAAEARRILAEAARQGRRIVEDARRQAATVEEQARSRGYEQGLARGREEGLAEGRRQAQQRAGQKLSADLADVAALARKIVDELADARDQILQEAREQMLDFAVELAAKIVGRAAELDTDAARHNLEKAMELAGGGGSVTVLVNPEQLESLRLHAEEVVTALRFRGKVKVEADGRVGKGGVLLMGRGGEVDATIATQLANVTEALRGSREKSGARARGATALRVFEQDRAGHEGAMYSDEASRRQTGSGRRDEPAAQHKEHGPPQT